MHYDPRARFPRLLGVAFATFGATTVAATAQVTVNLSPVADNTLYEDPSGALSNGSGTRIFAGVDASMNPLARRAVLRFDLGGIPRGSTVTAASLQMTIVQAPPLAPSTTMNAHRLSASWGEGASVAGGGAGPGSGGGTGTAAASNDATWLHRFFPSQSWSAAGGDFAAAISGSVAVGSGGPVVWGGAAMAADVQGWLDAPAGNHGWIVVGDESTTRNARAFGSRESSAAPVLTVTYTEPAASVTVFGTGCSGSGATPLVAGTNGNPTLGNPGFALTLTGGPPPLLQVAALSATTSPVPIPFGAPGCAILVDLLTFGGLVPGAGGTVPLPIPGSVNLLGGSIAAQGLVGDAATGLLVFSNALVLVIGR